MNKLKKFQIAILILVISYLTGCSDQLTSPVESSSSENQSMELKTAGVEKEKNAFSTKIQIKPNQSYSFDFSNTGYYMFDLFSIKNCDGPKRKFEVIGYVDDEQMLLSCSNSGFLAKSITVRNLTSEVLELDVTLSGSKVKPIGLKGIHSKSF